eukprot:scaffold1800_cov237-Pinguiococcus_pyrenoidosus.AAC.10
MVWRRVPVSCGPLDVRNRGFWTSSSADMLKRACTARFGTVNASADAHRPRKAPRSASSFIFAQLERYSRAEKRRIRRRASKVARGFPITKRPRVARGGLFANDIGE